MNRYRVEVRPSCATQIYDVMDYCVDVGNQPISLGGGTTRLDVAMEHAEQLNRNDVKAKAEWDQHHYPEPTDDSAKHYLRHNGVTHVVHGTAAAMDAFRAMNRIRIQRNMELQKRVVASQDEIANLRKQVHLAQLDLKEAERLRGFFDGRKYKVYLAEGVTEETGPQLAKRVEALIGEFKHQERQLGDLRKQRDSHVCSTAPELRVKGYSAEKWYQSWSDLATKCRAFTDDIGGHTRGQEVDKLLG